MPRIQVKHSFVLVQGCCEMGTSHNVFSSRLMVADNVTDASFSALFNWSAI